MVPFVVVVTSILPSKPLTPTHDGTCSLDTDRAFHVPLDLSSTRNSVFSCPNLPTTTSFSSLIAIPVMFRSEASSGPSYRAISFPSRENSMYSRPRVSQPTRSGEERKCESPCVVLSANDRLVDPSIFPEAPYRLTTL